MKSIKDFLMGPSGGSHSSDDTSVFSHIMGSNYNNIISHQAINNMYSTLTTGTVVPAYLKKINFTGTKVNTDWECNECDYKSNPSTTTKCNYCGLDKSVKVGVSKTKSGIMPFNDIINMIVKANSEGRLQVCKVNRQTEPFYSLGSSNVISNNQVIITDIELRICER